MTITSDSEHPARLLAVEGISPARYLAYAAAVSAAVDDRPAPLLPIYRAQVVADVVQRAYEWVVQFQEAQGLELIAQAPLLDDLFRRAFTPGRSYASAWSLKATPRGAAMKVLLPALLQECAHLETAAAARTRALAAVREREQAATLERDQEVPVVAGHAPRR